MWSDLSALGMSGAAAVTLLLSAAAVPAARAWGLLAGRQRIPALGGAAIMAGWWTSTLVTHVLSPKEMLGIALASAVILIGGLWDTRRSLAPWLQLLLQCVVAALAVGVSGIVVRYMTNPFGSGVFFLDWWTLGSLPIPGALLTFFWIVALMNVVNFLDGVDGLAAGVGAIAFLTIGGLSLLPHVHDGGNSVMAFSAAAALAGFLFWNIPPAGLYLGTTGSWFIGFLLAILSVQGATKMATVAVVGAVPLLDALMVILGRLRRGQSPFRGDRTHLHHRLERRGFSARTILLLYLLVSSVLGASAVALQTRAKLLVFAGVAALFGFLLILGSRAVRAGRH